MDTTEAAAARDCHLQLIVGVREQCSDSCLYYERTGDPPVGCLYQTLESGVSLPPGIARSLLKKAHRCYR